MGLAETEEPSLYDSACEAWAARAALDERAAVNSFQHQLWAKLKVSRDDYPVDLAAFPDEALPHLRIGIEIEGMTFCLNKDNTLAVVDWRCEQKGCERVRRSPIKDRVTLGRALALGQLMASRFPKCDEHS